MTEGPGGDLQNLADRSERWVVGAAFSMPAVRDNPRQQNQPGVLKAAPTTNYMKPCNKQTGSI